MAKPEILFLAHRIPYPPNKGDKIRSWHFLSHLLAHYTVHLGCFVDDDHDWAENVPYLRDLCGESHFARLQPWAAKAKSLAGLYQGGPLTLHHYRDRGLHNWVENLLSERPIDAVFVFSSAMAQYVMGEEAGASRRVIDFVDVDSDKWSQYAKTKSWPLDWLYRREGRELLAFDRQVAAAFDASLFVSAAEAELFRALAPEQAHKVVHINNGVDSGYFGPDSNYDNPYAAGDKVLVFTGAMDYWPNVDAVTWFAREILPLVRAVEPAVRFCIVGSDPTSEIRALGRQSAITVTGRVPDVRAYVAHATAVVAPLRIARGLQNKVLEGMSMARPVVATPAACQGLEPEICRNVLRADGARNFAEQIISLLSTGQHDVIGRRARESVKLDHDWAQNLSALVPLLRGGTIAAGSLPQWSTS
jgi:sugar transferase (PEP-CTERM/EpsH1 system associated)